MAHLRLLLNTHRESGRNSEARRSHTSASDLYIDIISILGEPDQVAACTRISHVEKNFFTMGSKRAERQPVAH